MDPSVFLPFFEPTDFVKELPMDLAMKVLSYLDTPTLLLASQVSKTWQHVTSNEELWKALAVGSGWTHHDVQKSGLSWKRFCMKKSFSWVTQPITVVCASQNGLAKAAVRHLINSVSMYDFMLEVVPMLSSWDYSIELQLQDLVIFVCDYQHDGIPGARPFNAYLKSLKCSGSTILKGVKYTMFVAGDANTEECNAIVDMTNSMDNLGAICVYEPTLCDTSDASINPLKEFQRWCSRMLSYVDRQRAAVIGRTNDNITDHQTTYMQNRSASFRRDINQRKQRNRLNDCIDACSKLRKGNSIKGKVGLKDKEPRDSERKKKMITQVEIDSNMMEFAVGSIIVLVMASILGIVFYMNYPW